MKKIVVILLFTVLLFGFLDYKYTQPRYKDITYTVEKRLKTGLFNPYKLYSVDSFQLAFSDDIIAIVRVSGTQKKAPHKKVTYTVLLEKSGDGTWKLEKIYNK